MGASPPPRRGAATAGGDDPLLRAVLNQLPGIVWATDPDLRCRYASPAATRRLGLAAGMALADAIAAHELLGAHRRALGGRGGRCVLPLADGVLACLVDPLRDAAGAVIGVLLSAEDTTASDHAARLLGMQRPAFAATFDHSPNGVAVLDAEGRFVYLNPVARRFEERDSEGTTMADGTAIWGEWRDDHGPVASDAWPLARALRGETVLSVDLFKILADGSRQYMRIAAAPIRDDDGVLIGATATAADVTDQKQLEERLRALNDDLEARVAQRTAALEQATRQLERDAGERAATLERLARNEQLLNDIVNHGSAVIYFKDLEGRYLLINRHFETLFHVHDAQQRGRDDFDLFEPAVAEHVRANDRQVLDAGRPMEFEEVVPSDGRLRTYVSLKFPLRDREGRIYGVCGMSTDITERKQMEAELRRSQATLSAIIESSSDPIVALDRQWQLVAMNAATAALIPALIGTLPPMHAHLGPIPADFAAPWRALIERALAGERFTVERALPVGDAARHFSISFNPTVQDGTVTGVAIFGRETTETRRAEERVRQHQAELAHVLRLHTMGEMAASLAHEVNQPLGAIANYAQGARNRIRAGDVDLPSLLAAVEDIASQALRAGEITRRVREMLRKEDESRVPVDLADVVAAVLAIVEATARRLEVTVVAHLAPGPLPVLADRIQIEQVVLNLLLNALDAAAAGAPPRRVAVRVGTTGDLVEVAVSDSGWGVDTAHAAQIFEPFFTTKAGGLGMGLAISRSIVDAHDGALWLEPAPGPGATFRFTLPRAP